LSITLERLSSGDEHLDAILDGGLPANAINLIVGLPGTGKTVLAQQYVHANATPERPALYLATVSEPFEKIIRYGQTFEFFDPGTVGRSVFYDDLSGSLAEGGLNAALKTIRRMLKQRPPGLLVIDSFKALEAYATDQREFRQFVHDLAGRLSALAVSAFWIGEYALDELATGPAFAIADAIISLDIVRTARREKRVLRPLKIRGSAFSSGSHAYRISSTGMTVFPRLADPGAANDYSFSATRQESGIPLFDEMLSEGYFPGSTTLLAGPAGIGKTVMGLHFIFGGARRGETGVIATMAENPSQLQRIANNYGWSLDERGIELMYRSPVDLYIDEWVYDLLEAIERTGARRVLIDSLRDIEVASEDSIRFREYVYSLANRCSRAGVSLLMTSEIPGLFHISALSDVGISQLSDNVILLQYVRDASALRRSVTVLKTRASAHDHHSREYTVTAKGIAIGEVVEEPLIVEEPLN
jgi:circadian clock protein KaiC